MKAAARLKVTVIVRLIDLLEKLRKVRSRSTRAKVVMEIVMIPRDHQRKKLKPRMKTINWQNQMDQEKERMRRVRKDLLNFSETSNQKES